MMNDKVNEIPPLSSSISDMDSLIPVRWVGSNWAQKTITGGIRNKQQNILTALYQLNMTMCMKDKETKT